MALSFLDYVVFGSALCLFALTGVYFALAGRQTSARQVLMGDRRLQVVPTALTIMASFLSAVSVLGFPNEVYTYGPMIFVYSLMYVIAFPTAACLLLPVLYDLRLTSAYEYLSLRFNLPVRRAASFVFCAQTLLYMAVVLYAPALALASVAPISPATSVLGTGLLAAFYTSLGGATAVVYTSAVQMLIILAALLAVFATGLQQAGGWKEVLNAVERGGRDRVLDYRLDPTVRHSFWSLLVGGTFMIWSLFTANQVTVQRYLAMPTKRAAKMTLLLNVPFNFVALALYTLLGFVLYAAYENCDPKSLGKITSGDQLLPFYVLERLPMGIPGLCIAAIYSAGLSTLAGGLNALSAVIYKDFVCIDERNEQELMKKSRWADRRGVLVTRTIAALCGCLTVLLALALSLLQSTVLQLAMSIFGLFGGPVLGLFLCGAFLPRVESVGAMTGLLLSLVGNVFLGFGAVLWANVRPVPLPVVNATLYCTELSNATSWHNDSSMGHNLVVDEATFNRLTADPDLNPWLSALFQISYQYYSLTGTVICVLVALIVSTIATACNTKRRPVPDALLCPLLRSRVDSKVQMDSVNESVRVQNGCEVEDYGDGGRMKVDSPIHTPALRAESGDEYS